MVKHVLIVGGGTAGWMTAAALSEIYHRDTLKVTLIESEKIGTVGVGEATIPHLRYFNQRLGINEHEFMRATQATYKLGIDFVGWGGKSNAYIHPFGEFGLTLQGIPFHHYWLRAAKEDYHESLFDFSVPVVAAKQNRFSYPSTESGQLSSTFSYAFHIDANKYASYLRTYAEQRGVVRHNATIVSIDNCEASGNIRAIRLEDGSSIEADLFIDCSGFSALLIDKNLGIGYEDWSHWLPCDRAVAVPRGKINEEPKPYTTSTAHDCGWRWEIPLQNRTGNGMVYASQFMSDELAAEKLLMESQGEVLANFNFVKFKAGRRKKTWSKNCISIGLSSGFLEPLESTSIYLIQLAIMKLAEFFPIDLNGGEYLLQNEFNRQMEIEYDRIKDFLILHYKATHREDSEFWRYCRAMGVPDSLAARIDTFLATGHVDTYTQGLFLEPSWVAVFIGQGFIPKAVHPIAQKYTNNEILVALEQLRSDVAVTAKAMPKQADFLTKNQSMDEPWPQAAMSLYGVFS